MNAITFEMCISIKSYHKTYITLKPFIMKKKNIKSLKLNKKSISRLDTEFMKGGTYLPSVHNPCKIEPASSVNYWCTLECSDLCD